MSNYETIPKLLRVIASASNAKASGQDVIFTEAARLIDENEAIIKLLEDVPGDTALDKVIKLKSWYQELSNVVDAINGARSV